MEMNNSLLTMTKMKRSLHEKAMQRTVCIESLDNLLEAARIRDLNVFCIRVLPVTKSARMKIIKRCCYYKVVTPTK